MGAPSVWTQLVEVGFEWFKELRFGGYVLVNRWFCPHQGKRFFSSWSHGEMVSAPVRKPCLSGLNERGDTASMGSHSEVEVRIPTAFHSSRGKV